MSTSAEASRNWDTLLMRKRITGDRFSRLVFGVLIAAILIGFLVSLLPLRAAAHDHHSYHAEFYSKWVAATVSRAAMPTTANRSMTRNVQKSGAKALRCTWRASGYRSPLRRSGHTTHPI